METPRAEFPAAARGGAARRLARGALGALGMAWKALTGGRGPGAVGRKGERAAVRLIRRAGLRILARNLRAGRGEIDILALDGPTLVFVEVKSRSEGDPRDPTGFERFDRRKLDRLRRSATLIRKRLHPPPESLRLDLVVVFVARGRLGLRVSRSAWYPAVADLDPA